MHPSMQPQDIAKLCYQAARGAEHLLTDKQAAKDFFFTEFATVAAKEAPLFEAISERTVRVNLAAWKARGMDATWLWTLFANSSCRVGAPIEDYLAEAEALLQSAEFSSYIKEYKASGMPTVHHSEAYRKAEAPAYRIVDGNFAPLFPILEAVATKAPRVIAIDGRAAAGKTTAANTLSALLNAPVIRMDDFFLPPALRTAERLNEAGGNVHYERFATEVLPALASGEAFAYGVFDCSQMAMHGVREIPAAAIRIVEGAYSHHPRFGDYADLRVFFHVAPDEQMRRILARNGEAMAEMFRTRWIPMEEAYHAAAETEAAADIRIDTTK